MYKNWLLFITFTKTQNGWTVQGMFKVLKVDSEKNVWGVLQSLPGQLEKYL